MTAQPFYISSSPAYHCTSHSRQKARPSLRPTARLSHARLQFRQENTAEPTKGSTAARPCDTGWPAARRNTRRQRACGARFYAEPLGQLGGVNRFVKFVIVEPDREGHGGHHRGGYITSRRRPKEMRPPLHRRPHAPLQISRTAASSRSTHSSNGMRSSSKT